MTIQDEIQKELERLGYDDIDTALRSRWKDIPRWLQKELLDSGFVYKDVK